MSLGLTLTSGAASAKVSLYVGVWVSVWMIAGAIEKSGVLREEPAPVVVEQVAPTIAVTEEPGLPVLTDEHTLRGTVDRSPAVNKVAAISTAFPAAEPAAEPEAEKAVFPAVVSAVEPTQPLDDGQFYAAAPAGFADLIGIQNTQADVYFQDRLIVSTFIEYDLERLWFMAPEEIVAAIPTLKNPERILQALSGEIDSNSRLLCNARTRTECGELRPEVAGVIFDESKFRVELFIAPGEQELQMLAGDRYLPAPTASWATLHDMSFSASGQFGNDRYNLSGESFLAKGGGRARVRYGLTNSGASLHEASWQWDKQDQEYEFGAFRSARGNSLFVNDMRLLGIRIGSSTKTRTDLDNALATPVFAFLARRSRVDILRDGEVLDSRFYDPGNHQLDTTRLPDGAYDIVVKTVAADGAETEETQFFVRDSLLPPLGEKQHYLEIGAFTEAYGSNLPRLTGGGWLRGGISHRLSDGFALEASALVSSQVNLIQGGAYFLGRGWQLHAGVMASDRGDNGAALRGQFQRKNYVANFSAQHLSSKEEDTGLSRLDPLLASNVDFTGLTSEELGDELLVPQNVLSSSFTQASAALSFPMRVPLWNGRISAGRAQLQARYNTRGFGTDIAVGFNYRAPLFKRHNMAAEWNFEGLYSNNRSLVRMGFDFRWRDRGQTSLVRPELFASNSVDPFTNERSDTQVTPGLSANWQRQRRSERFGDVGEGLYINHDSQRSVLGSRLSSQTKYGYSDLDVFWQEGQQDGFGYAANSRFSLVSTEGKSSLGGGSNSLAAIVVEIDGDLPDTEFQIIVGSRVAGYASTGKRGVVSVRPYESYAVKILPTGDKILGYDERSYDVTLFPGNVHRLVFAARSLRVLVSQAVLPDGSPLSYGKFTNVEGFGVTDRDGWFQVEVAHSEPLALRQQTGDYCELAQPPQSPEDDGLAVVDAMVCRPIPAPPSK